MGFRVLGTELCLTGILVISTIVGIVVLINGRDVGVLTTSEA